MNVVFGARSNLSLSLSEMLDDVVLISGQNAQQLYKYQQTGKRINIIINSFQKNTKLNDYCNPEQYVSSTLGALSNIIKVLIDIQESLGVVIYTSSASVYGDNPLCNEEDQVYPVSLYASLKISSEIMIRNYLSHHNIRYIIARVFNMYGGNDQFSIISKILESCRNNEKLNLINNGRSVRDFIHISDVCNVYKKLLCSDYSGVINVATGCGFSVNSIILKLYDNAVNLTVNNITRNEINVSLASVDKLKSIVGEYDFIDINDYILKVTRDKW